MADFIKEVWRRGPLTLGDFRKAVANIPDEAKFEILVNSNRGVWPELIHACDKYIFIEVKHIPEQLKKP